MITTTDYNDIKTETKVPKRIIALLCRMEELFDIEFDW